MRSKQVIVTLPGPVLAILSRAAAQHFVPLTRFAQRILMDWAVDLTTAKIGEQGAARGAAQQEDEKGATVTSRSAPIGALPVHSRQPRKTGANNSSGFKGVQKYGSRWAAVVYVNGAPQRVGVFNDPEHAARAYDNAARVMIGPNAPTNFPEAGAIAAKTGMPKDDPLIEKMLRGEKVTGEEWDAYEARLVAKGEAEEAVAKTTVGDPSPRLRPVPLEAISAEHFDWLPTKKDD